jgi:hypothetical protein
VLLPVATAACVARGSWTFLATWAVALAAYCAFWLAVSIAISLRTSSASSGFVIGASTWLALVIVAPALANLSAPLLAPSAATISYVTAERAASLDINARIDAAFISLTRTGTIPRGILNGPTANLSRPQLQQALAAARVRMYEERLAPVLAQVDSDERRLDRAVSVLRFCSPALLFDSISTDLAGTGRARWQRFLAQVDTHVRAGRQAPFTFEEERTRDILIRIAPRVMALLILAALGAVTCRQST